LEGGVVGGGEAEDQEMEFAVVFGEPAGEFFGSEDVGEMRDAGDSFDGVVIGDGDEVHVALKCLGVDGERIAVAFGAVDG
jgi:hypothetical protein